MDRLTEENQIGCFASLKDKAASVVGGFTDYDCFFAYHDAITKLKQYEDAATLEQVQAWAKAEREEVCDNCFFKLRSDAWKFNTYPCRECKQRTKSHFRRVEEEQ